jgi:hypothetical protein
MTAMFFLCFLIGVRFGVVQRIYLVWIGRRKGLAISRSALDIRRWILESRQKHVRTWMTVAAIFGWILSRLPARKTKVYIQSADPQTPRKKQRSGGLPAALRKSAWLITKPLLVAYLTKKIAEKAKI